MMREKIKAALQAERERGLTIREIAERHGVSAPYICTILKDSVTLSRMTIEKIETMYPRCDLILDAESPDGGIQSGGISQNNLVINGNAIQRIIDEKSIAKRIDEAKLVALNAFKSAASNAILAEAGLSDATVASLLRSIHSITLKPRPQE